MGEVYLGEHVHMGRKAAIKVLLPELSSKADVVARFFNEARATALLKHPGIVEVLDCDVHTSGRAYIVMEYLAGESLGEYLGRVGSLRDHPRIVAAIAGQIAAALAAAHGKGIIHRDLKPDNVFLSPTPEAPTPVSVKILDFGIAKLVGAADTGEIKKTRTGSLLGTPLYMSPEQCRGAGGIDARTDIYSLGCIIFEALSGRPPFVREGAGELIVAHVSEAPPELSSLVPSVPPALGQLVMQMLAKDPGQRPPSMADVVRQIEDLLGVAAGGFLGLVALSDALAIRVPAAGARATGTRTQVMPSDEPEGSPRTASAPGGGHTQLLTEPALRVHTTASSERASSTTLAAELPAARPGTPVPRSAPRLALWLLVVAGLLGGAAVLSVRRWGHPFSATGTRAHDGTTDSAALAVLAPFLQTGAEPPFPDRCRTTDSATLRPLATIARDLGAGAPQGARARGLAEIATLPDDGSTERWMVEARATLAADPRRAERAGARAVSLCPTSAVAANVHGNALQRLQQIAPAEAAYRAAIRLAPTYLAPRFNLGLLQLRGNDAPAALAIFDEIARDNPDYPNIHLVRAEAHRRAGDRAAATADLQEHVRRQPDSAEGWLQLGRALSSSDGDRARAAFCRAKALGLVDAAPLCPAP